MNEKKQKEGVTVKELENFAKKHSFEVVFSIAFVFACLFSFVFYGAYWAAIFASIGGVLGIIFPNKMGQFGDKVFQFIFKQESMTQLILAIVLIILSIFLPPLIYFVAGIYGGKSLHRQAARSAGQKGQ